MSKTLVDLEDAISAITEKMGIGRTKAKEILQSLPTETKEEWVSVEERLPKKETFVIVFANKSVMQMYYGLDNDGGYKWWLTGLVVRSYMIPTHWMPLPESPIN